MASPGASYLRPEAGMELRSISLILVISTLARAQGPPPAGTQVRAANGSLVTGRISSQPPPAPASYDCAADGTVVNSVTGEPIARAHVNIVTAATAYSTTTDPAGRWALANLGCAPAQLNATRPGFLRNAASAASFPLVPGSPVRGLKTELVPQSVAWGRVLDEQGDPLMAVQITALVAHVVDGRFRFQQGGSTTTNDLGEYRLANLPRGKYIVCTHQTPSNGQLLAQRQTITADSCYPGPVEGGLASTLDLPPGREAKIDFTLMQVTPVHIRGTATGYPEGRSGGVNLVQRAGNSDMSTNAPGVVREGKFDFQVAPGSYVLTADYFEAGKRLSARLPVNAGSSDVDNLAVRLESGFTITGVMRTVSTSGVAAPQFGLQLHPSDPLLSTGGQLKWNEDHTTFTISDVIPGNFRLDISPPPPFYVKSATLAGQDILNSEVPIAQAAGPLEITLRDDGGSIEGDVVDSSGQPAGGWAMLLSGSIRAGNVPVQPSGHFKLQNVAPGDYTIYAWDDATSAAYADPEWMRQYGNGGAAISVSAGQNSQIKLSRERVSAP